MTIIKTQIQLRLRLVIGTFGCLLLALCSLALLSAPDATHDESFHMTNIYCGRGERPPYCEDIRFDVAYPSARVSFDYATCQRSPLSPLACPRAGAGDSVRSINHGDLYPPGFYWLMSWFVVPSQELSVILVRWATAFSISMLLAFMALLLPIGSLRILNVLMMTTLPATGYFLFGSVNPSSWTVLGVGFGWLSLSAALSLPKTGLGLRPWLLVVTVVFWLMAVMSRWDATPFVLLTLFVVILQLVVKKIRERPGSRATGTFLLIVIILLSLGLLVLVEWIAPIHVSPFRFMGMLASYSDGEPNNLTFFTHYLLDVVPMSLGTLNSLPTTSSIGLPRILAVVNVYLLVSLMAKTRDSKNKFQFVVIGINVLAISLVTMAWVDLNDQRDFFGIGPRYVLPLLVFSVGWWLTAAPPQSLQKSIWKSRNVIPVVVTMHAIMVFTLAERFVDRQTFGLRLLPEGPDYWWWSGAPIGPNVVLLLAVAFFAAHLVKFRKLVLVSTSSTD